MKRLFFWLRASGWWLLTRWAMGLKMAALFVTIGILFYEEEDWRGARAWSETQKKWEAQGESFDVKQLFPPAIPNDENLAKIALFDRVEAVPQPRADNLMKALRIGPNNGYATYPLGSVEGEKPLDLVFLKKKIADTYKDFFPQGTLSDSLDQFNALYPFISDLIEAAKERPSCQFTLDKTPNISSLNLSFEIYQVYVSKTLMVHAILSLEKNQSEVALNDLKTNFKLASGLGGCPLLITSWIESRMAEAGSEVIHIGLVHHQWNVTQLSEIDSMLRQSNQLEVAKRGLGAEIIANAAVIIDLKQNRSLFLKMMGVVKNGSPTVSSTYFYLWPDGWLDMNLSDLTDHELNITRSLDPESHRVAPVSVGKIDLQSVQDSWEKFQEFSFSSMYVSLTHTQVTMDQVRIACALEKSYLSHGNYPKTLSELSDLPKNPIDGYPYKYQVLPGGIFRLSCAAWNIRTQTDSQTEWALTNKL